MGWRDTLRKADLLLDRQVARVPDVVTKEGRDRDLDQVRRRIRSARMDAANRVRAFDDIGDRAARRLGRSGGGGVYGFIMATTKRPLLVILVTVLIVAGLTAGARIVIDNMRGELEIYLPPGHPATDLLVEVREDWSTDVVVIYVETEDRNLDGHRDNITTREILLEMSVVEGDDENTAAAGFGGEQRGLDWDKEDGGDTDGITFVLSLSQLIKEINVTSCNAAAAVNKEAGADLLPTGGCGYSLPDQATIDGFIGNIPADTMGTLVKDVYGLNDSRQPDGVWDTAIVLLGISRSQDPDRMVPRIERATAAQFQGGKATWLRLEVIEALTGTSQSTPRTHMVNTGPYTVIQKLQYRTIGEFLSVVPWLLLFLGVVLYAFHRNPRIVIVALFPVGLALGATLGITGYANLLAPDLFIISPQIALMVPILLALGVAYGIYIANQFSDEKGPDPRVRMARACRTMHSPVFLSAVATGVGFASLMVGTLPPIFTLGFALTVGIMLVYVMVLIVVPPMVVLLRYEKKFHLGAWRTIATLPGAHRKKIIAIAVVLALFSAVAMTPQVSFNADFLQMMPQDDPSIIYLGVYSRVFAGGQMGMVIFRGGQPGALTDVDKLKVMDSAQGGINSAPNTTSLSVVDLMKAIAVPASVGGTPLPGLVAGVSFWDAILAAPAAGDSQTRLIRIFYNTLSPEIRGMMLNTNRPAAGPEHDPEQATKSLIYVFMPSMDIPSTQASVDAVNLASQQFGQGYTSRLTGVAPLTLAVNALIIEGQLISLALTTVLTAGLLAWVYRSWKKGLLTTLPCIMVIALEPWVMVGLHVPLSLITVMIGSIAIGTGVDYSIQISSRLKQVGINPETIRHTVQNLGISFLEATATTVAAFAAILYAPRIALLPGEGGVPVVGLLPYYGVNIGSVREFVVMIVILLSLNAVMALMVLPAFYTVWHGWHDWLKKFRAAQREDAGLPPLPVSEDPFDPMPIPKHVAAHEDAEASLAAGVPAGGELIDAGKPSAPPARTGGPSARRFSPRRRFVPEALAEEGMVAASPAFDAGRRR